MTKHGASEANHSQHHPKTQPKLTKQQLEKAFLDPEPDIPEVHEAMVKRMQEAGLIPKRYQTSVQNDKPQKMAGDRHKDFITPLKDLPYVRGQIFTEYRQQIELMGQPRHPPRPISEARKVFADVRNGDGKYVEAIAAIMWHCSITDEEAEDAIGDWTRFGRPSY